MSRGTQVSSQSLKLRLRGSHPLWPAFPDRSASLAAPSRRPYNPVSRKKRFGLFRFRSPLLAESSLFLELLRCFSSLGSLSLRSVPASPGTGFPIRTSPAVTAAHASPELFAVYHVLHRHLTPRHPPYALTCFYTCDTEKSILSRYFCYRLYALVNLRPVELSSPGGCL